MAPGMAVMAVEGVVSDSAESAYRDEATARRKLDRDWSVSTEQGKAAVLSGPGIRIAIMPRSPPRAMRPARFVLAVHLRPQAPDFTLKPGSVLLKREASDPRSPDLFAQPVIDAGCLEVSGTASEHSDFVPPRERDVQVRQDGHCFEVMFETAPPVIGEKYTVQIKGLTKSNRQVTVPEVEFLRLPM